MLAAGFALRYPQVRLEVTTEERPVDMIEEACDLVIRVRNSALGEMNGCDVGYAPYRDVPKPDGLDRKPT